MSIFYCNSYFYTLKIFTNVLNSSRRHHETISKDGKVELFYEYGYKTLPIAYTKVCG